MHRGVLIALAAIGLVLAAGCAGGSVAASGRPTRAPANGISSARIPLATRTPSPASCPGKGSLQGNLYSFYMKHNVPETMFYATAVQQEGAPTVILVGPQLEKGDIQSTSDSNADVRLNCVPPRNYYLVVWAPYSWDPAVNSPTDQSLLEISVRANQVTQLGTIYLAWP